MRKTKKTLIKRVKVTKGGKVLKKQNRTGHLKRKMDASRKNRKSKLVEQENAGHKRVFKTLLGKHGRKI
jgi:ribosomal protein L35